MIITNHSTARRWWLRNEGQGLAFPLHFTTIRGNRIVSIGSGKTMTFNLIRHWKLFMSVVVVYT